MDKIGHRTHAPRVETTLCRNWLRCKNWRYCQQKKIQLTPQPTRAKTGYIADTGLRMSAVYLVCRLLEGMCITRFRQIITNRDWLRI